MATIATPYSKRTGADSWEIPEDKPWLVQVARPWLKNPVGLFGLVIVVAFFVLGVVGPYVTPYDPTALDAQSRNLSP